MKPGSRVVYVKDPQLFGVGVIDHVLANGRIVVMFEEDDLFTYDEQFDPLELELETVWQKRMDRLPTVTIPAAMT